MMETITRRKAVTDGKATYFTGKACKNGHIASRNTSSRKCYECERERDRARKDESLARARAMYHADHKWREMRLEKAKARAKNRRAKHRAENPLPVRSSMTKAEISEKYKAWQKTEAGKVSSITRCNRRRTKKKEVGGCILPHEILGLLRSQNYKCAICESQISGIIQEGKRTRVAFELDHVIALVAGGPNTIDNAQMLCPRCNRRKGSLSMDEFYKRWPELKKIVEPGTGI